MFEFIRINRSAIANAKKLHRLTKSDGFCLKNRVDELYTERIEGDGKDRKKTKHSQQFKYSDNK